MKKNKQDNENTPVKSAQGEKRNKNRSSKQDKPKDSLQNQSENKNDKQKSSSKKTGLKDPFAKREAGKYPHPIASRELILEQLQRAGQPLKFPEIAEKVFVSESDEEQMLALQRRLKAMTRDGQLVQNRRGAFGIIEKMDVVKGRVSAYSGGFGFLIPDDGSDDLFLSPGQMKALFDGDVILAKVSGVDRRGRKEGRVVDVLERHTHELVGRCFYESGVLFLSPDSKKITQDILIVDSDSFAVTEGNFVVVEITRQPSYRAPAIGKIREVLGEHMAPGMEIDVAIRAHQIPHVWSEDVEAEIVSIPESIQKNEVQHRIDLRQLDFVTIDGEDARDFDDAVFCEKQKQDWRLCVAIADVAHYVKTETALDDEARKRGNSVYFPQRVIPMLPEKLSNGLCSLNPNTDRLTLVCEMRIDSHGKLIDYRFMEAMIYSKARLTYTEVAQFLASEASSEKIERVKNNIEELHHLFRALKKQRDKRGAINVETVESRFIFDEGRKISSVVPVVRNVAHQIIEEAMLMANVCAAKFLQKHQLPALYRAHDAPAEGKLLDLKDYLAPLGFRFSAGKDFKPAHFQEVISFAEGRKDKDLINIIVLRSMKQAVYSAECSQHFGLAYEQYAHFTSPIRRYADLIVHRAIKYFLRSRVESAHVNRVPGVRSLPKKEMLIEDFSKLSELGVHVSQTERRADLATRDASDWLKCEFMLDKVGNVYQGKISSVTAFGLFVLLDDIFIEGLVHISDLQNDYYHFDEKRYELTGEKSKRVFSLADVVKVKVASVNLDEKKIEFLLAEEFDTQLAQGKAGRSDKPGKQHFSKNSGDKSHSKSDKQKSSRRGKGKKKSS